MPEVSQLRKEVREDVTRIYDEINRVHSEMNALNTTFQSVGKSVAVIQERLEYMAAPGKGDSCRLHFRSIEVLGEEVEDLRDEVQDIRESRIGTKGFVAGVAFVGSMAGAGITFVLQGVMTWVFTKT